jgi:hypothetical protein
MLRAKSCQRCAFALSVVYSWIVSVALCSNFTYLEVRSLRCTHAHATHTHTHTHIHTRTEREREREREREKHKHLLT